MNIKNMMSDFMMGNMTSEEKSAMMDQMMDKFFTGINPEDKQRMMTEMMEKFMGGMSAEEKQAMMATMSKTNELATFATKGKITLNAQKAE
jgi:hypothetical protein